MSDVPSLVQIPIVTTTVQASIDNNQVTTSAGAVQRQVITNADPENASNYQRTDAAGNSQTREAVIVTETDASQSALGTSPVTAIAAGLATSWVDIMNISTNGNLLGYTFDGSAPGFTGGQANAGTKVLVPYGSAQYAARIPSAALKVVGSDTGTVATIKYA